MDRMVQADTGDHAVRYKSVAVAIHWITAALLLTQVWIGLQFADMAKGPARDGLFTWHKTLGATILLLAIARLVVRLRNPPPPFPQDFPKWERFVAVWNHRIFYVLLIALPLTGLATVSAAAPGWSTPLIGGIPLPLIPGLHGIDGIGDVHVVLVWTTLALLVLHVGAALKQQFFDKSDVADRMPPFHSPRHGG
jgi:cytochrome b561